MSNIEIEYKFEIANKLELSIILDKIGKRIRNREYQSNTMFDNSSGLMQSSDGRVRLRIIGDNFEKVLTYKKPLKSTGGTKKEIEYEIDFVDKDGQIEQILNAMDFKSTTFYEKYRTEWELNNTQVVIDEYPFADFIEIEGEEKDIKNVAKILNLNIKDSLNKAADTLFQEWRKTNGLPFKEEMKFNNYNK